MKLKLAINYKGGLTKPDQMINIKLRQSLHRIQVGIATNDLVRDNRVRFVWEFSNQIAQAASSIIKHGS